jgi:sulfur carrier protein
MNVTVALFETLKKHGPEGGRVRLETGARVADLLSWLGITEDDVGVLIVNRKDARFNQVLQDGDVVTVIPPMGGG